MTIESAKTQIVWVLEHKVDADDLAGFLHLDPQNLERMVRMVEDHDPHWIYRHVRDTRYSMGVRLEIAGKLRGSNANQLLLEILGA